MECGDPNTHTKTDSDLELKPLSLCLGLWGTCDKEQNQLQVLPWWMFSDSDNGWGSGHLPPYQARVQECSESQHIQLLHLTDGKNKATGGPGSHPKAWNRPRTSDPEMYTTHTMLSLRFSLRLLYHVKRQATPLCCHKARNQMAIPKTRDISVHKKCFVQSNK